MGITILLVLGLLVGAGCCAVFAVEFGFAYKALGDERDGWMALGLLGGALGLAFVAGVVA